MPKIGDVVICGCCGKPLVLRKYHLAQKFHLDCSIKKCHDDRKEYYREFEQTGRKPGRPKDCKPNIGPLDTVMPEENRYDEWVKPEYEERYNKMIKRVISAKKRYDANYRDTTKSHK